MRIAEICLEMLMTPSCNCADTPDLRRDNSVPIETCLWQPLHHPQPITVMPYNFPESSTIHDRPCTDFHEIEVLPLVIRQITGMERSFDSRWPFPLEAV